MRRGAGWQVTGERGSALLGGLMFTLIITVLGFALFDLTLRESRLAWGSQADYMAFETAQAGLERTLHLLFLDVCGGSVACTDPDPTNSWADGNIRGVAAGPDSTNFYSLPLANNTACFRDPCDPTTNTYSVQLKNLTKAEASGLSDIGLLCTPATDNTCQYLIYVRVTGQYTQSAITSTRTIQVLAGAKKGAAFGGGMLGGGSGGRWVSGNALIAGDLQLVGCQPPPCTALSMTGTVGVRNNYNAMPASLQARIPPLPLVTCPAGTLCAGSQVESLGATVRVARFGADPAINLAGAATLGTPTATANPVTGQFGKPSLDKVFIGDGCDLSDCSDEVGGSGGAQNIYSDTPIRPNEVTCPPACLPGLTDTFTLNGIKYATYAACPAPNSCAVGSTNDFFIAHAFKIVPGTLEDPNGCPTPPCTRDLYTLLTTAPGLKVDNNPNNTTPSFTKTFACGPECNDTSGNRVNGAIGAAPPAFQPPAFQLQWDKAQKLLRINQCSDANCTSPVVFSEPLPLPDPPQSVLPVLFYVDGPLKICEGCSANATIYFQGQATFLAQGDIRIDSSFLASCPVCPDQGGPGSDHDAFPRKSLLSFLTPGNVQVGFAANRDIMGVFYASGQWETQRQTNIVGTVTAGALQMGPQVPKFFQVPQLSKAVANTVFRPSGAQWSLTTSKWQVCRNPTCS